MSDSWYLRTQDDTFGPVSREQMLSWARMGRIQPGQEASDDNVIWRRVEEIPFLDMRFSIDLGDGSPRGPFNRAAADALVKSGRLPPTAQVIESRPPFEEEKRAPEPVRVIEKVVEVPIEKLVEVPVEKIVEKIVEVPVEKIVEREVEKIVIDETRVKELEELLAAAQTKATEAASALCIADERVRDLQGQLSEAARRERELKDAIAAGEAERGRLNAEIAAGKGREDEKDSRIADLDAELKRLPQTASEVADVQAAVYSIMTKEAAELAELLEVEKKENEEFRRRQQERADRMLERRRELLKRSGENLEDMTRRALVERPIDPRTAQLRKELEDHRRLSERRNADQVEKIRDLEKRLEIAQTDARRLSSGTNDLAQLRAEAENLRERLQLREKELLEARQTNEQLRVSQAAHQQTLMARLATLESPSIAEAAKLSTNQTREARLVKLPGWMHIGK